MSVAKTSIRTAVTAGAASLALVLSGCNGEAQTSGAAEVTTASAAVQEKVDAIVNDALTGAHATEAIVGVWLPDGTAYVRGYGEGVSAQTLVRAGQQTAPATCALLLELANDKLFGFDEKITDKTPRQEPLLADTTYRQLCDGNSRFADYKGKLLPQVLNTPARPWSENELLAESAAHSPVPHAGLDYHLSDTNAVLGLKLARTLSSQSSSELLETRIFKPANMHSTYYPELKNATLPEQSLTPLAYPGAPGAPSCDVEPQQLTEVSPSFLAGAGATITTVGDLKNFYTLLFDGHYGNQRLFAELNTPHSLANPKRDESGNITEEGPVADPGQVPYSETALAAEKIGPLYGRSSWLPGAVGATFHDPETNFTVSIQLNNSGVTDGYARETALLLAAELGDAGVTVPWTAEVARERVNSMKVCQ
ncbi:serine hydrolase [Canibacter oris]|uniref:CubicO group peptidase (Beta-lactamase class C family) n=1 Tax=Canibacter oris TaxID=1365628 RepID=A0A840DHX4_9MICO|nr:CubicO group peptidase (beta-lactamase class C family) [Canibacter oris]